MKHSLRSAHASAAPWEGQNALDAAFLAYSSISVLRQQMHPTHRVHGIMEGKDWAPNSTHLFHLYASLLIHCSYPGLCQNDVDRAGTYLERDVCAASQSH